MPRAVSIHIGVNRPQGGSAHAPLVKSEEAAWSMAGLAGRAGYESILVLRGPAATRAGVHDALAAAARTLQRDDLLFVSFSGHGGQEPDANGDERSGRDESWCLYDGELLDDKLAGYWRLFEPGVRIVVVSESCFSGGMIRDYDELLFPGPCPEQRRMRGEPDWSAAAVAQAISSCIAQPPADCCEIRADVLMLTASSKEQLAEEGLFTHCLLKAWDNGSFEGSYCELYRRVRDTVTAIRSCQHPQILLQGSATPALGLAPAFRVAPEDGASGRSGVKRGGGGD